MKKKGLAITLALVLLLQVSVLSVSSVGFWWWWDPNPPNDPPTPDEPIEIEDPDSFYYNLGEIYDVETDDGLTLKMLRYHPPIDGATCNDGGQPILLLHGILANMNTYLMHSTDPLEENFDIEVPDDMAEWAEGDENIEEDPMLYYSMAYYLWKNGYDPFFVNYRGNGYKEMKSDMGDEETSLDDFAIYDVPPSVRKVYEITGQHPVLGGHSTGGFVTYVYLQGCEFKTSWWSGTTVVSNQVKSNERNGITEGPETILGYIAIDPAMIPRLPSILDSLLSWMIVDMDIYLDIRWILDDLLGLFFEDPILFTGELLEVLVDILDDLGLSELFVDIINTDPDNMNPHLMYYLLRYVLDNIYLEVLSQYMDFAFHEVAREHYQNGRGNSNIIIPPSPSWWDDYYYYSDNMDMLRVPLICFLASHDGEIMDLVRADKIIEILIGGKTPDEDDYWCYVPGAHVDAAMGTDTPKDLFPKLGNWLEEIV